MIATCRVLFNTAFSHTVSQQLCEAGTNILFADKETEAEKGELAKLSSWSCWKQELGLVQTQDVQEQNPSPCVSAELPLPLLPVGCLGLVGGRSEEQRRDRAPQHLGEEPPPDTEGRGSQPREEVDPEWEEDRNPAVELG